MAQYLLRKNTRIPKCDGCFCNKMPHNLSGCNFLQHAKCYPRRVNILKSEKVAANIWKNVFYYSDEQFWVDEISKIIFPVSFGIFNLIFWCYVFLGDPGQCDEIEKNGFIKLQN